VDIPTSILELLLFDYGALTAYCYVFILSARCSVRSSG
jgi:hypothetical protein